MSLAVLTIQMVGSIYENSPNVRQIRQIWQASKLALGDPSEGALMEIEGASVDAEKFIDRIKGREFRQTKMVKNFRFNLKRLKQPEEFTKLGPSAKIRALRSSNISRTKMNRFFETGASVNLLKSPRHTIGGVASAVRCYVSFCEFKGIRPFPIREKYIYCNGAPFSMTRRRSNNISIPSGWLVMCSVNQLAGQLRR